MLEAVDIGKARQVAQRYRLFSQQRAGNERQCRILRARNGNGSGKAIAAAKSKPVVVAEQRLPFDRTRS